MAFDQNIIDEVGSLTDIVQIVSLYIPLKKAGANYKALCPFHKEKTPSFMVSSQKQIYHCFGCGQGGNVFSFVMKMEGMSFPEALRYLAEKCGVKIPERSALASESKDHRTRLTAVLEAASQYYQANLWNESAGQVARDYLKQRGINVEVAKQFQLGWATSDWRSLIEHLVKAGFRMEELESIGLVSASGEKRFDLFRSRLMFPILNVQGKPVGFGGRILGDEQPKYLNSPETILYKKRRELYNLNNSRAAITRTHTVLVVEGYMDLISLWQFGIQNVVATLGTALTSDHVRILKRYAESAIIVYDGDEAGIHAALRGLEVFLEEELPVRVLALAGGVDPDDLVRREGRDAFLKRVGQAQDIFDFKFATISKDWNVKDSAGLTKITSEMLGLVMKVKNQVLADRYLKHLASDINIREEALRAELSKKAKLKRAPAFSEEEKTFPEKDRQSSRYPEEEMLVGVVLLHPEYLEGVFREITVSLLEHEGVRALWQQLEQFVREEAAEKGFSLERFVRRIQSEAQAELVSRVLSHLDSGQSGKIVEDCIRRIRLRHVQREIEQLQSKIKEAEARQDEDELRKHLKSFQELVAKSGG